MTISRATGAEVPPAPRDSGLAADAPGEADVPHRSLRYPASRYSNPPRPRGSLQADVVDSAMNDVMTPILTLSNSVQRGVATIWSLPEVAAAELQQALEAAHLATLDDDLSEQVASKVDSIPRATIDEVLATLARLSGIVTDASVPIGDFGADVYVFG